MPRINQNKEAGKLYLALNEKPDFYSAHLLHLTNNLLDDDVSDRLKRIAGDPTLFSELSPSPITSEFDKYIGFSTELGSPWPKDARKNGGLSPVFKVTQTGPQAWSIKQPELQRGDLLWCAPGSFEEMELRHVLPGRLSAAAISRVIERKKEHGRELAEYRVGAEKAYFDSLPELDPLLPIDLFEGVQVTEAGESVRFEVPTRKIVSEKYGSLELKVTGRKGWFKTDWDYGSTRFAMREDPEGQWASAHWLPHAFVLEDIDPETGLPIIVDQERVTVNMSIGNPYRVLPDGLCYETVGLHTPNGTYDVFPNMETLSEYMEPTHVEYDHAMLQGQINPQKRLLEDDFRDMHPDWDVKPERGDKKQTEPLRLTPRELWVPLAAIRANSPAVWLDINSLA